MNPVVIVIGPDDHDKSTRLHLADTCLPGRNCSRRKKKGAIVPTVTTIAAPEHNPELTAWIGPVRQVVKTSGCNQITRCGFDARTGKFQQLGITACDYIRDTPSVALVGRE